ncbi:NUDIX domain-containing protein [Novosphingobium sp. SG707]|uniref:NUDIX hydrolase n=1 Tax=Novosphingobium sp. SG707 TaxID=2586996 RepID=UPI001447FE80|nr:NUDIX domain-containing protein [Novosphingobium sp. SG707]NKJ00898.1 8-oxo-dGTP diphosphatase [Novosphingobium sp. SG707]
MNYPLLAVTVDLVLMSVVDDRLCALLQRRGAEPFTGHLALPGGFVGEHEGLEQAARRILTDKAGFAAGEGGWLEQLYTFGDPGRDPRMRTVSVAYFALLTHAQLAQAVGLRDDLMLVPVGALPEALAFDHAAILALAHDRLRGKLDYAPVAFALLPDLFTLRDLQRVHEAITGNSFSKPAFRRRMLDTGWIEPTGERETQTAFRPAELYQRKHE